MRRNLSIILTLAALASALCSCGGAGTDDRASIVVQPSTVYRDDISAFVKVRTDRSWTLTSPEDWVSFVPSEGTGDRGNVIMLFDGNDTGEARSATVELRVGGRVKASAKLIQLPYLNDDEEDEKEHGKVEGGTVSYGKRGPGDSAVQKWMELPAMDADTDFIYYTFNLNGATLRNYSFGWNQDAFLADWVAYPMGAGYPDNGVGRTDAWDYDPILGSTYSPAPFGGYCGNYDRGHQIPSEDRQSSREANRHTFFGSNMTPQYPQFNQEIWASLENQVRGWAHKSDTLYVVTGCVVKGSTKTEYDSDGHRVKVPVAYWKVLLRYSRNSSLGYSGYMGVAFYLEHKQSYSEKTVGTKYSMSVDALEEKLGMDFFVNLPEKIGASAAADVEAQKPDSWWFK